MLDFRLYAFRRERTRRIRALCRALMRLRDGDLRSQPPGRQDLERSRHSLTARNNGLGLAIVTMSLQSRQHSSRPTREPSKPSLDLRYAKARQFGRH